MNLTPWCTTIPIRVGDRKQTDPKAGATMRCPRCGRRLKVYLDKGRDFECLPVHKVRR